MVEGLFQPIHLILILVLVLIFFGPGKLTEIGTALGNGMRELRRGLESRDEESAQTGTEMTPRTPAGPPSS